MAVQPRQIHVEKESQREVAIKINVGQMVT